MRIIILILLSFCGNVLSDDRPPDVNIPFTIFDLEKGTVTMPMELYNSIEERLKAYDLYIREDRKKLKQELEDEDRKANRKCI